MRARMVSVGTVAAPLRRAVRDIARASGKRVRWELAGEDTELDRHVLEQLREPLVALVRNATDHGIESPEERAARGKPDEAVVRVHAMQIGADVVIAVGDDGRGIDVERVQASAGRPLSDAEALRAIFEPGLTTAEQVSGVSGRGVGLDAVRSAVDALRGRVEVRTEPGRGTEFRISVPMTLAVLRCLLVRSGARAYALPMHSTATALPAPAHAVVSVEGRPTLMLDGDAIGFAALARRPRHRLREAVDGRRAAPAAVVLATASGPARVPGRRAARPARRRGQGPRPPAPAPPPGGRRERGARRRHHARARPGRPDRGGAERTADDRGARRAARAHRGHPTGRAAARGRRRAHHPRASTVDPRARRVRRGHRRRRRGGAARRSPSGLPTSSSATWRCPAWTASP